MNIREILFPTDFSRASESAGRVARELALKMGARLHVVHVALPGTDPAGSAVALTDAASTLGNGVTVETALLSGRAVAGIIAHARDKHVDVIVMGTHGRTGISRQLLGSVAEAVVRLAPRLVLTVPAGFSQTEDAAATIEVAPSSIHHCIVCAGVTDDLICEACRARIRGEALERKINAERSGRLG